MVAASISNRPSPEHRTQWDQPRGSSRTSSSGRSGAGTKPCTCTEGRIRRLTPPWLRWRPRQTAHGESDIRADRRPSQRMIGGNWPPWGSVTARVCSSLTWRSRLRTSCSPRSHKTCNSPGTVKRLNDTRPTWDGRTRSARQTAETKRLPAAPAPAFRMTIQGRTVARRRSRCREYLTSHPGRYCRLWAVTWRGCVSVVRGTFQGDLAGVRLDHPGRPWQVARLMPLLAAAIDIASWWRCSAPARDIVTRMRGPRRGLGGGGRRVRAGIPGAAGS
jgi:hypothetical protein